MFDMEFPESFEEAVPYLFLCFLCAIAALVFVYLFRKFSKREEERGKLVEQQMKEWEKQEKLKK